MLPTLPGSPRFEAVLLAAGESARMGQVKALLPWQGKPLIQYQVASLANAGIPRILVVLGHRAEPLRTLVDGKPGVEIVLNLRYKTGKSSSVRAALRHLSPQVTSLLVLAVDQPRTPETIRHLLAAHQKAGALLSYPTYQGKGGHPVVFSITLLPELMRVQEARQGLREVVVKHRHEALRVAMDSPEVVLDLNEPGAYRQALSEADRPHRSE